MDATHWQLANGQDVEILNLEDDHSRFFLASVAPLSGRSSQLRIRSECQPEVARGEGGQNAVQLESAADGGTDGTGLRRSPPRLRRGRLSSDRLLPLKGGKSRSNSWQHQPDATLPGAFTANLFLLNQNIAP
jgi:hypothetical protein